MDEQQLSPTYSLKVHRSGEFALAVVLGEVHAASIGRLRAEISAFIAQGALDSVLDVSGVRFVGSLLELENTERLGPSTCVGHVVVRNATDSSPELLRALGLGTTRPIAGAMARLSRVS